MAYMNWIKIAENSTKDFNAKVMIGSSAVTQ